MSNIFAPLGIAEISGGPNGEANLAGGLDFTSTSETHKGNLSLVEADVSSQESWLRRFTHSRVGRLAFFALSLSPLVACAHPNNPAAAISTAHPGETAPAPTEAASKIFNGAENLDPSQQEALFKKIALYTTDTINGLSPLDKSLWAACYRHEILQDTAIAPSGTDSVILDTAKAPDGPSHLASALLDDYTSDIIRLAWYKQNNPAIANDERTTLALLGTQDSKSPGAIIAADIAQSYTVNSTDVNQYVTSIKAAAAIFNDPTDIVAEPHSDGYTLNFNVATARSGHEQQFSYNFYPVDFSVSRDAQGNHILAKADLVAGLGTPMLATLPKISTKAA